MVVYVSQNNLSSRSAASSWWNIILIMATSQEWLKLVLERILLKICRVFVYEFPVEITMILRGISIWFEQWLIFIQIYQFCSCWNRMPSSFNCLKCGQCWYETTASFWGTNIFRHKLWIWWDFLFLLLSWMAFNKNTKHDHNIQNSSLGRKIESGGRKDVVVVVVVVVVFFFCALVLECQGVGLKGHDLKNQSDGMRQPCGRQRCAKTAISEVPKRSFVGMHCLPSWSVWPCRRLCLGGWGLGVRDAQAKHQRVPTPNHLQWL